MSAALLRATGLSLNFGGVLAVDDVTIDVGAQQVTALIGPNGAGKTTLFNLLSGILQPSKGRIVVHERDVTGWPSHRIASLGIARTFQNLELFGEMSVRNNVLVGRHRLMRSGILSSALRLPRQRAEEQVTGRAVSMILEQVGLEDVAEWPATALPYGLQRRVELARALAAEPFLIMLDEPLAGLAVSEIAEFGRLIRDLVAGGLSVLLVEHHMVAVMGLSDELFVLDQGHLIARGNPAKIQTDEAVIAAYLGQTL